MTQQPPAIVATKAGKVDGSYEDGLFVFKGIPYAEPPVGDLRWLPPQGHKPWKGIREAREFGASAPQPGSRLSMIPEFDVPGPQNEDCLFLNVWTPGLDIARRPVMVWIHGGAFSMGSGSQPTFRGGRLARVGNIVLVTLNYRLGVLGFLNLNEVTGGLIPSTGNEGLLDQIAVLEWVKDNISSFGGDPDNVTIFGESAGAMSVGCLLAIPRARGLFHKAILESAVGDMAKPLDYSVRVSRIFLELAGLEATDVKALRALPVDQLLSIHAGLSLKTGGGIAPAIPVADGNVLPGMPLELIKAGSAKNIPVIAGSNLEEWKLFAIMPPNTPVKDEFSLKKRLRRLIDDKNIPHLIETYKEALAERDCPVNPQEIWSAVQTDLMFRLTALSVVVSQCRQQQAAYNYIFNWKSPAMGGRLGACHSMEVGLVFGTFGDVLCGTGAEVVSLSAKMQEAWITFARTGNPSCPSLGEWPPYCDKKHTMILEPDSHVEEAPDEAERQVWDNIGRISDYDMP
jgi:para-nitrobenzyl esterase